MNSVTADMREIARQHEKEISSGERFEFGKNWSRFFEVLDEDRILKAEESLRERLETESLAGKTFLDIRREKLSFLARGAAFRREGFSRSISIRIPTPAQRK